jgi:hypothetical protein
MPYRRQRSIEPLVVRAVEQIAPILWREIPIGFGKPRAVPLL